MRDSVLWQTSVVLSNWKIQTNRSIIITNMFQIHFSDVTFAQSSKYVMIVKNKQETKRSQVCSLWTSVPSFNDPIIIDSIQNLIVKACQATIDRKLTVIGSFKIQTNEFKKDGDVFFEGSKDFTQILQQKQVCVGNCKITITQKREIHTEKELKQIDDEFQLKSQSSESDNELESPKCQLKFIIHGGFDFYLNAGFKVSVNWGQKKGQTRVISNRMAPFWGKTINLQGKQNRIVEIAVYDNKGSKLEWMKLDPKQIRIMYPYHLHIYFREEYVGLHPHFYVTIIREDVPLFSILDKKINFNIKYVGPVAPQRTQQYLLIYPRELEANEANRLPLFVDLSMKNYIQFANINKIIESSPDRKYEWTNWNLLVPINVHPDESTQQAVCLLKSFLSRSLVCVYFSLDDAKSLFCNQVWNNVTVLDRKEHFQNSMKELYYQEKRIVLGKAVQLTNLDVQGLQNEKGAVSLEDRWKILTHNYVLRKKMLEKSIQTTQSTKKEIKQKGEYLEQLKKVLIQVKKMNAVMVQKQKSSMMEGKANQKIRQNYHQYPTMEIIASLLQKQVELQKRKKINDEMRMRMDSLHYFNQDSDQLNKIVVENAQKLLQQQGKMKQMKKIKEALPKQREVISKLQKIFEKRQIDKSMNQLLNKQQNKLNEIKKSGNKNLQIVYNIVKDHKNSPHSLLDSIKASEKQLIRLNAQYAKLTTL